MRTQKLFIGAGMRRLRESRRITQADLAQRLRVSTAYLSQMETNQRPVSASVLLALTQIFGASASDLMSEDPERLAANLREALADPVFRLQETAQADIRSLASATPWLAHRLLELHAAYRQLRDNAVTGDGAAMSATAGLLPFEEVRDFFLFIDNYVDELDKPAEALALSLGAEAPDAPLLLTYLQERHGVRHQMLPIEDERVRRFDRQAKVLATNGGLLPHQRAFHVAVQIAWLEHGETIDAVVARGRFTSDEARQIARVALANYFAGALQMPYRVFRDAAMRVRHDLQLLSRRSGASLEQVCHRLSTLQRPGLPGVPVYFVKLDRAGTIVKRHNANRFQFARFGGGCPLWNVHDAFTAPDRIHVQKAELPDGSNYLCLAFAVAKDKGRHGAPPQSFALGLGCSLSDAKHFVYADDLDLGSMRGVAKIGVSCRLCPRTDCGHRSVPPAGRRLDMSPGERGLLPYVLS